MSYRKLIQQAAPSVPPRLIEALMRDMFGTLDALLSPVDFAIEARRAEYAIRCCGPTVAEQLADVMGLPQ